jgi:hypothetical protein
MGKREKKLSQSRFDVNGWRSGFQRRDAGTPRKDKKKNSASRRLRRFNFFFNPLNPHLLKVLLTFGY